MKLWENIRGWQWSLILVQSWPLSSSYVFSEFDFGSELTIVVLLCLLRVWFWFRVDHCRPLMCQLWTKMKLWENIRGWQWSTLNQNQTLSKHKRTKMPGQLWTKIKLWENIRGRQCSTLNQNHFLVQSWPLSSSYVYSEFDFGSELTIVVLLCFFRVWFWFRVDHCRPLMFSQSLILLQSWPLSKLWVNIRGRQCSTLNQNQTLSKHKRTTMVNFEPK
jgi:hypothetical protein